MKIPSEEKSEIMKPMKAVLLAALLALASHSASAEGAIAVAEPKDVAADGYSSGFSYNYNSRAEADERALSECRDSPDASPATKKLCKVVRNFRNQCVAVALDPQSGTPGAGWAVGDTLEVARRDALRACEDTAGRDRQGKCEVTVDGCDGSAK